MRIGIDSYSYHRLLGEIRPGEDPPGAGAFPRGSLDVVAAARRLGADLVALETCFLGAPDAFDAARYRDEAGGVELALSWGHPAGLEWGARPAGLADLLAWIGRAPDLGARTVRFVVAGPGLPAPGDDWLPPTAAAVGEALDVARGTGVALAVENHADLTVAALERLLDACPGLGVCLDTANALRVGDEPVEAARRLEPHIELVHLKDVEPRDGAAPLTGPRSVPYGTGAVDVDGVLEALAARPAGLPVCVELGQLGAGTVDERAIVADAVAWLRSRATQMEERWRSFDLA